MTRWWSRACLASFLASACAGQGVVVERSAPERPAWLEQTPVARDSLYFVGICSDLASYQDALRCARGEALTDLAAWVGGRFTSYVYSSLTTAGPSSRSTAAFDAALFLENVRREQSYYEIRGDVQRAYDVAVLVSYPRRVAEEERNRIQETTAEADRLVEAVAVGAPRTAAEGRWGDAMDALIRSAGRVLVPNNLSRGEHAMRLAGVAEDLVSDLALTAALSDTFILIVARYRTTWAAGLPVQCVQGARATSHETGSDGRASCDYEPASLRNGELVLVRPDINGYLSATPTRDAGPLLTVLGSLLDLEVVLEATPSLPARGVGTVNQVRRRLP